jgi:hypothetical protein
MYEYIVVDQFGDQVGEFETFEAAATCVNDLSEEFPEDEFHVQRWEPDSRGEEG